MVSDSGFKIKYRSLRTIGVVVQRKKHGRLLQNNSGRGLNNSKGEMVKY